MATLIKLTRPDGRRVYVNMDVVATIDTVGDNTTIAFVASNGQHMAVVTESPEEVARAVG